jgi:hypothetical protein
MAKILFVVTHDKNHDPNRVLANITRPPNETVITPTALRLNSIWNDYPR